MTEVAAMSCDGQSANSHVLLSPEINCGSGSTEEAVTTLIRAAVHTPVQDENSGQREVLLSSLRRPVGRIINSVKNSYVTETCYSFVKRKSPLLVRALSSTHVRYLVEKVTPVVSSVVDRLDDGADVTTGCVINESADLLNGLHRKKDEITTAVQTQIEHIRQSTMTLAHLVYECPTRRDSITVGVSHTKDVVVDGIRHTLVLGLAQLGQSCGCIVKSAQQSLRAFISRGQQQVEATRIIFTVQLYGVWNRTLFIVREVYQQAHQIPVWMFRHATPSAKATAIGIGMLEAIQTFVSSIFLSIPVVASVTVSTLKQQWMCLVTDSYDLVECLGSWLTPPTEQSASLQKGQSISSGSDLLDHLADGYRQYGVTLYLMIWARIWSLLNPRNAATA